jgi:hypothetical protein
VRPIARRVDKFRGLRGVVFLFPRKRRIRKTGRVRSVPHYKADILMPVAVRIRKNRVIVFREQFKDGFLFAADILVFCERKHAARFLILILGVDGRARKNAELRFGEIKVGVDYVYYMVEIEFHRMTPFSEL